MTLRKYSFLILLISFSLWSCEQKAKNSEDNIAKEAEEIPADERIERELHDQVMAVHDEVMPQMDVVMNIKGQLVEALDSLAEISPAPTAKIEEIEASINALEKADEGMMNWMRKWSPPADTTSHESKVNFYDQQKTLINDVRKEMSDAIENSKVLLKSYK